MNELLSGLRLRDYDKFLACNYAEESKKLALAAIFNFNLDIQNIPLEVSEAMIGQIKFQWWRDVLNEILDGKPSRPHPILLALKGHDIDYKLMISVLDEYEKLLEDKLPQHFAELADYLQKTELQIFKIAASILGVEFNTPIALGYIYNLYARKLMGKNEPVSGKLFDESKKLIPLKTPSLFGSIAAYYNKRPRGGRLMLNLSLVAGRHELL